MIANNFNATSTDQHFNTNMTPPPTSPMQGQGDGHGYGGLTPGQRAANAYEAAIGAGNNDLTLPLPNFSV